MIWGEWNCKIFQKLFPSIFLRWYTYTSVLECLLLMCFRPSCSSNNHRCTCSSSKRQTPSNETTTLVLSEVNSSVSSLKHCMEEIKLSLDKLASVIEIKFLGPSSTQPTMYPNSYLTQNMEEDSISITSVWSFFPDDPQIHFNWRSMTSPQSLLMLLINSV